MVNMSALPAGYIICSWCSRGVRLESDGSCPSCQMTPTPTAATTPAKGPSGPSKRSLKGARIAPLGTTTVGQPVLGVDPGARYVGIVLRDGDVVLLATTLVRDKSLSDPITWARLVLQEVQAILFTACPAGTRIGIEGVNAPSGFSGGKQHPLDPGPILFTGVVAGAVAGAFLDAHIVPPGNNGTQNMTHYPAALQGRRPTDLPGSDHGAGTREHTRSAYDVAGKAARHLYPAPPRPPLEMK